MAFHDLFGPLPFRSMTFDAAWRTDTAVSLASQMYDSRDFSTMPILADTIQDAGCDSEDILAHCRGPGPHVRGCWGTWGWGRSSHVLRAVQEWLGHEGADATAIDAHALNRGGRGVQSPADPVQRVSRS